MKQKVLYDSIRKARVYMNKEYDKAFVELTEEQKER